MAVGESDKGSDVEDLWHVSFHGCVTGDTEIVTRQGIKPIKELIGEQELLIPSLAKHSGLSRAGRGQRNRAYTSGGFKQALVSSYGVQQIFDVKLRRGRQTKLVRTTGEHRWMLKSTEMVCTCELQSGQKLKGIKARKISTIQEVPFAVAQGFVYGDGTARRDRRDTAWLDLHHNNKDQAMLRYFSGHKTKLIEREGRMTCTQIQGLPRTWKSLPSFDESTAFLLSWVAGYFAADGSVSKTGQATLASASKESIDCVRGILSICGVGYGYVNKNIQNGIYPHGAPYEDKTMYNLTIDARDLPSWFFVLPSHKKRILDRLTKSNNTKHEWEVVSVDKNSYREEVFCATVPDVGCFALSDELLTGNSQFPGDDPKACGRQALYRMMNIPRTTGSYFFSNRKLTQIADAGKDIEDRLVMKWHGAGYLLSPPPYNALGQRQHQFVMESPDEWLTSTVDAITLPRRSITPVVTEVKSKYADVIEQMQMLQRGPDDKHVKQIKAQIGLAREDFLRNPRIVLRCFNSDRLAISYYDFRSSKEILVCPQHLHNDCLHEVKLKPPHYGYLYYVSRDNPTDTFEFYIEHDEQFMASGRAKLIEWQQNFINNVLPQTNFTDKRFSHPFGWLWGDEPCKWCDYGDHCRSDHKKAIEKGMVLALHESEAVEFAKGVKADYELDLVKIAVGERWGLEKSDMILSDRSGEEPSTTTVATTGR